jgi:two-component system, chemotaxis family, response regulator Rcp1
MRHMRGAGTRRKGLRGWSDRLRASRLACGDEAERLAGLQAGQRVFAIFQPLCGHRKYLATGVGLASSRRVFSLRGDSSGGFEADDRPTEILPVEDNEDDGMRTRLAFEQSGLHSHLHHAKDGEDGMAFLRKQTAYTDVPPNLIRLDLNMLPKDGREVLAEIAADESLCQMPVVILTISSQEQKILKMYRLRASSYIVERIDFENFLQTIRLLHDDWFRVVMLPTARH